MLNIQCILDNILRTVPEILHVKCASNFQICDDVTHYWDDVHYYDAVHYYDTPQKRKYIGTRCADNQYRKSTSVECNSGTLLIILYTCGYYDTPQKRKYIGTRCAEFHRDEFEGAKANTYFLSYTFPWVQRVRS